MENDQAMQEIQSNNRELISLIEEWEPRLLSLQEDIISGKRNSQNRTIREIVGHMLDSASNNTHRVVHLHYRESPVDYPNYASHGNNDRWIAIQNYQEEDWFTLVQAWKYSNLHLVHVFDNIDPSRLSGQWKYSEEKLISLEEGAIDYLRHFKLHLDEISELL